MEIMILTGTLISAFLFTAFSFGFYVGMKYEKKSEEKNAATITKENAPAFAELMNWLNYGGNNGS